MLKTVNTSMKVNVNPLDLEKARFAIGWLASRCDFASSNDGMGFSGTDAVLGHALAEKDVWSSRETATALHLVVKYKKQLLVAQIDTSGLETASAEVIKSIGKGRVRAREMVSGDVRVADNAIIIKTDSYNAKLVDEIKELIGRRWDPKLSQNTCTLCAENAAEVEEMAQRYGLKLHKHRGWAQLVPTR